MLCINLNSRDPFFCLAAEEYFLKNFSDDVFMLWKSSDTVVIGKHQNALGEIDYKFVKSNNIKLARRISGGGAVFHDTGNLNFTYIKTVQNSSEIDFDIFTQPLIDSFAKLNLTVTTSGYNNLITGGRKISGNAQHIYKNRVLHHGTLLFNSDLKKLGLSLKADVKEKYISKGVKSIRSEVVNIADHLHNNWTFNDFRNFLLDEQLQKINSVIYELTQNDCLAVDTLADEKFRTWKWNFGYSPAYDYINLLSVEGLELTIKLHVEKGLIIRSEVTGNFFSGQDLAYLNNILQGKRHHFEDIKSVLQIIKDEVSDDLVFSFF
jgi:lipoate-protein ligase A